MDATASVLSVLLKSKSVEVSYSSYFLPLMPDGICLRFHTGSAK